MDISFNDTFELLMRKSIYAILDGDEKFDDYKFSDDGSTIKISMPYLSGSDLCEISTMFGLPMTYSWGGVVSSRWQYLQSIFDICIKTGRCSDLLAFLFSKQQFSKLLTGHQPNVIDTAHKYFVKIIIDKINGELYFSDHELIMIENQFSIKKIGDHVEVQTPKIKIIDQAYIKSISSRAMEDIEQNNFDSAITKSRTLIEEVFYYVIERKNGEPSKSGKINELYKQVKTLYNMHGDENIDKRINMLLSGLEKIVSSISEMRNISSDAHGVGENRITIEEHHARLFVNAAMVMADFILAVESKCNGV